jgi:RHS repeat-associated protein
VGTSDWDLSYQRYFVYDGWNLIVELDGNANVVNSVVLGLDLSDSEQGAGGVGGLLMLTDSGADTHFVGHDGNGNVTRLVDSSLGTITASYEYSPFGKRLSATGTMALVNPFRFSNKYEDDESGFNYYGFRFYNPDTGRWLNRDPISEKGCINIYAFTENTPIGSTDLLGLANMSFTYTTQIVPERLEFMSRTFNGGIKTRQTVKLDPDKCKLVFAFKYIGKTIEYSSLTGPKIGDGQANGSTIRHSIFRATTNPRRCEKKCVLLMWGDEGNPRVAQAPGIF